MTRRAGAGRDPLERAIELALRPGSFVPYHACFSFVCDLGAVKGQIQALTRIQASRAVDFCETFLAGCHENANEIDDSGGSFGQFVQDLCCDWIKARQANKDDPAETASKLLAWMDDDPWGFCYDLDRHAVKVLNKPGLAAFEKAISRRFETAMTTKRTTPSPGRRQPSTPDADGAARFARCTRRSATFAPMSSLPNARA